MGNNSSSHSHSHGASGSGSGSSSSSSRQRAASDLPPQTTTIDGGFLEPQSMLYPSQPQEYSRPTVHKLILERRLAPFYLGLQDFDESWSLEEVLQALSTADSQATQNLRDALVSASEQAAQAEATQLSNPPSTRKGKEAALAASAAILHRERLSELIRIRMKKGGGLQWSSKEAQARLYIAKAVECPICFLYYPPTLVHTRCCDQPICTECFVQIKRADPTTTHLESEPAACPFCMESNFGCFYFREVARPIVSTTPSGDSGSSEVVETVVAKPKPRRKSFAHTEKNVVTTDQLHPDWEAKVEAVRATVARRANRRIVFRQVGDRLIPVGITSGREGDGANATMTTTTLPPGFAAQVAAALDPSSAGSSGGSGGGGSGSGREGRRAQRRRNAEMAQLLESMGVGLGGQDLEEMMVMEAMRLSMLEDEERQKKEREKAAAGAAGAGAEGEGANAETSAQGLARSGVEEAQTPNTPRTTATLLSEALSVPIGSTSSNTLMDPSPLMGSSPLPSLPALQPSHPHTPSTSRPSTPSLSSSPSRPTTSKPSTPSTSSKHKHSPSIGALAAGSLAAAPASPAAVSSSLFDSGSGGVGRGIVGAGLTAAVPAKRRSVGGGTDDGKKRISGDFGKERGLEERMTGLAVTSSSSSSSSPSSAGPSASTSTSTSARPSTSSPAMDPVPSFSNLSQVPSTLSTISTASSGFGDDAVPLTPSQGYQQLLDDDEEEMANGVAK
ncbi:hypothetical protein T439DRAFT_378231 [Meredithblackwellia eburnea MCA 4105]